MQKKLIKLVNYTESFLVSIGGKANLRQELSYYDWKTLRPQFPLMEHLAVRLFDSWWNTTRKQLLLRGRFPNLERALHKQGVQDIASKSISDFNEWLIKAFGISADELGEKLYWKQFVNQGGAWACLNFIAQFTEPENFYEWVDGSIGAGSWKDAKRNWQECVVVAWEFARNIAYQLPIPKTNSKGILGMGTVLMCDYLKEIGVELYGKPDNQVKGFFKKIGLISERDPDEDWKTFQLLWRFAVLTDYTPAVVDKFFWIARSGRWDKTLDSGLYRDPPILTMPEARENRKERAKEFDRLLNSL